MNSNSNSNSSKLKLQNLELPENFIYVVIFLCIIYISTRIVKAKSSHIFGLIVSIIIIYKLQNIQLDETITFNNEIDYKYKTIGNPSHFYMDVNLINLYYSIYKWKNLNSHNYNESIASVNNILKIEQESKDLNKCVDNYEIALEQSKNALNMMHGFIYNISHKQLVEKLNNVLKRLQQLLTRHLEAIRMNCNEIENKKDKIDVHSRFIEDHNGPKAFDEFSTTQFDLY